LTWAPGVGLGVGVRVGVGCGVAEPVGRGVAVGGTVPPLAGRITGVT
jgi:hypothetical protein